MLRLVSGPFHPGLESAFVDRLKTLKKDPFVPVAIVAPSGKLMDHLQTVVADQGLSFLNVHFHTFSSLAHHLVEEGGGLEKPVLSDSLFYDTLVKQLVKKTRPFPDLPDLAVPHGFPPQIRSTIRDMIDAGIPPDGPILLDAVKEDFLGKDLDVGWLLELLRFYQQYAEHVDNIPHISSPSSLLKKAIEMAPSSSSLASFKEILYYGFYDVTGLQRDFFEAVVQHHPSTLFFPFVKDHADFKFASRLRDTTLLGLTDEEESLSLEQDPKMKKIVNVSGLSDEAWVVTSEVLKLHQEDGIPFSKMAIVSRSQDRLHGTLPYYLTERQIPFRSARAQTYAQSPQIERAVTHLKAHQAQLPQKSSWSNYVKQVHPLLGEVSLSPDLVHATEDLSRFDYLGSTVSFTDFLDTLKEKWMRLKMPSRHQAEMGVSLLYAEAARGLAFDVVFLIGVEEKVFPRIIREDPFLRDDARFELQQTLGYKIGQKLTALEEEQLLFHLIVSSAKSHLILTYQRSDDTGSVIGPSTFLRAFADSNQIDLEKQAIVVPRMFLAKLLEADPSRLSPKEVISGFLLANQTKAAVDVAASSGLESTSLQKGLTFQKKLQSFGAPGPLDGMVTLQEWKDVFPHGLGSATSLETFGRCPFQYFATRLLDLAPLEEEEIGTRIPADKKGHLVHTFFEIYYTSQEKDFEKTFSEVIDSVSSNEMEVHPLIWDVTKSKLKTDLMNFLDADQQDLKEQGLTPTYFEQDITGNIAASDSTLTWFAKPDRIDIGSNKVRVLDYKTGKIAKKVALASLQGLKMQPALYMILTEQALKKKGVDVSHLSFVYRKLGDQSPVSELSYEDWLKHKNDILNTLKIQLELMKKGTFLIMPDDNTCSWCEVQQICRKNHGPSLYRSQQGPGKVLQGIRNKK